MHVSSIYSKLIESFDVPYNIIGDHYNISALSKGYVSIYH